MRRCAQLPFTFIRLVPTCSDRPAPKPNTAATTQAHPPQKKDNLLALGGMLAGSSLATGLVMHFVGASRRGNAAADATAAAPDAPATPPATAH